MAHPVPSASRRQNNVAVPMNHDDAGKLLLRLLIGVLMLLHGLAKIQSGPDMLIGMLTKAGLPGAMAYLVYVGEVLAPVLVIVGIFTRPAAWVMVIHMLFAIGLAHSHELLKLKANGGWALELQGMFLFGAIAIALFGAGRYSLGGPAGRWN